MCPFTNYLNTRGGIVSAAALTNNLGAIKKRITFVGRFSCPEGDRGPKAFPCGRGSYSQVLDYFVPQIIETMTPGSTGLLEVELSVPAQTGMPLKQNERLVPIRDGSYLLNAPLSGTDGKAGEKIKDTFLSTFNTLKGFLDANPANRVTSLQQCYAWFFEVCAAIADNVIPRFLQREIREANAMPVDPGFCRLFVSYLFVDDPKITFEEHVGPQRLQLGYRDGFCKIVTAFKSYLCGIPIEAEPGVIWAAGIPGGAAGISEVFRYVGVTENALTPIALALHQLKDISSSTLMTSQMLHWLAFELNGIVEEYRNAPRNMAVAAGRTVTDLLLDNSTCLGMNIHGPYGGPHVQRDREFIEAGSRDLIENLFSGDPARIARVFGDGADENITRTYTGIFNTLTVGGHDTNNSIRHLMERLIEKVINEGFSLLVGAPGLSIETLFERAREDFLAIYLEKIEIDQEDGGATINFENLGRNLAEAYRNAGNENEDERTAVLNNFLTGLRSMLSENTTCDYLNKVARRLADVSIVDASFLRSLSEVEGGLFFVLLTLEKDAPNPKPDQVLRSFLKTKVTAALRKIAQGNQERELNRTTLNTIDCGLRNAQQAVENARTASARASNNAEQARATLTEAQKHEAELRQSLDNAPAEAHEALSELRDNLQRAQDEVASSQQRCDTAQTQADIASKGLQEAEEQLKEMQNQATLASTVALREVIAAQDGLHTSKVDRREAAGTIREADRRVLEGDHHARAEQINAKSEYERHRAATREYASSEAEKRKQLLRAQIDEETQRLNDTSAKEEPLKRELQAARTAVSDAQAQVDALGAAAGRAAMGNAIASLVDAETALEDALLAQNENVRAKEHSDARVKELNFQLNLLESEVKDAFDERFFEAIETLDATPIDGVIAEAIDAVAATVLNEFEGVEEDLAEEIENKLDKAFTALREIFQSGGRLQRTRRNWRSLLLSLLFGAWENTRDIRIDRSLCYSYLYGFALDMAALLDDGLSSTDQAKQFWKARSLTNYIEYETLQTVGVRGLLNHLKIHTVKADAATRAVSKTLVALRDILEHGAPGTEVVVCNKTLDDFLNWARPQPDVLNAQHVLDGGRSFLSSALILAETAFTNTAKKDDLANIIRSNDLLPPMFVDIPFTNRDAQPAPGVASHKPIYHMSFGTTPWQERSASSMFATYLLNSPESDPSAYLPNTDVSITAVSLPLGSRRFGLFSCPKAEISGKVKLLCHDSFARDHYLYLILLVAQALHQLRGINININYLPYFLHTEHPGYRAEFQTHCSAHTWFQNASCLFMAAGEQMPPPPIAIGGTPNSPSVDFSGADTEMWFKSVLNTIR